MPDIPPTTKAFNTASFEESLAAVRGGPLASAFFALPTPHELLAIYSRGFRGVRPETTTFEQKRRFGELRGAMPKLYDIFPWAKGYGKGKVNCPFTAIRHFFPEWGGQDAQDRGDCTVHGTYNAASMDYGTDCLFGEAKYVGPLACENIYRSRGYNGDGWSCEAPCSYVGPEGSGGFLYRTVYKDPAGSESVDLSRYNSSWEGNGRAGVPKWLEEISAKNKVKWVIPISSAEEYRDAIAMGFGINVCSGQGFSSSTDEYGVARAQGSWSHSMAHTACIDTDWARSKYSDMIGGIQQSWGNWNTINGKPEGAPESPVGIFYSKFNTILDMLSGDDSFALCGVWGWDRTSWEAFDVTDYRDKLIQHLRNSTTQDYYVQRTERLQEGIKKAAEEFTAI